MPKIRPVSDLRNYNEVLREISVDEPVFLTKNGRGRYAIVDIDEYERTAELIAVVKEMVENSAAEEKYTSIIKQHLCAEKN